MLTARMLPKDEWDKLQGTELGQVYLHLACEQARVIVVEDDGVIVGCWAVVRYTHAEGVWTDPSHRRKGAVARMLLRELGKAVTDLTAESGGGSRAVFTGAETPEVAQLLSRHLGAVELPWQHFVFAAGGS